MVTTTIDRAVGVGNGSATAFNFAFKVLEDAHLLVYLTAPGGSDTLQTITTHYTVTGAGTDSGTVTFVTPPTNLYVVTIKRSTPLTQLVDYIKQDNFPAESHEGALDKLALIAQEYSNSSSEIGSGIYIQFPVSEPTTTSGLLPDLSTRADKTLAFDSGGQLIASSALIASATLILDDTLGGGSPSTDNGAVQSSVKAYVDAEIVTSDTANSVTDQAYADSLVRTIATQSVAEARTNNTDAMTPLRSAQLVETYPVRENLIHNSGFTVDIEGKSTGVTSSGNYPVESFRIAGNITSGSYVLSRDFAIAPPTSYFSLKHSVTGTGTIASNNAMAVQSNMEGWDVSHLMIGTSNAKTVTFSFKVYGSTTGTYGVAFRNAHSTATRSYIAEYTIDVADTWETKTITIDLDQSGTWDKTTLTGLSVHWELATGTTFEVPTVDTWTAGDYYGSSTHVELLTSGEYIYFAEPKLEEGDTATAWEPPNHATELVRMQRYFQFCSSLVVADTTQFSTGVDPSWTNITHMRTDPGHTETIDAGSGAVFVTGARGFRQTVGNSVQTTFSLLLDARL